jgi:hypothetical protein
MNKPQQTQHETWCRHRTSFDKAIKVCKAGVNFHTFEAPGEFRLMPCLGETPEAIARCAQYSARTPEELAEREREAAASMERICAAIIAIREATNGNRGLSGNIPCPTCSKPLHYSVARVNGHIHAKCETPQCVSFLQ